MFEPSTLPSATSDCLRSAATAEVTSSGSEVPTATMVRPTSVSDMPNSLAMVTAAFTSSVPPPTMQASPASRKAVDTAQPGWRCVWGSSAGSIFSSAAALSNAALCAAARFSWR